MYDAVDDPYTYENSTVLRNKLDLRAQDVGLGRLAWRSAGRWSPRLERIELLADFRRPLANGFAVFRANFAIAGGMILAIG